MVDTKYLLIGSSHAALSAIEGIRMKDNKGPILMVGAEGRAPYSPTILPYVISGKKDSSKAALRDEAFFKALNVSYLSNDPVIRLDTRSSRAYLRSGKEIAYERALLATGAAPQVPPVPGLQDCTYQVLRTMEDALRIKTQAKGAQSAIIIGAGLIGMHLAEALNQLGMKVTVVEALPNVLGVYFDERSSQMIRQTFENKGIKILTGCSIAQAASGDGVCALSLGNGLDLSANMLIVATGVKPRTEMLDDNVKKDKGVIVDEFMKTNIDNLWAAGDVVECKDFFEDKRVLSGILPNAVQEGLIAGRSMADDTEIKPFPGAISMNTYGFFGNKAISIGNISNNNESSDINTDIISSSRSMRYQKIIYKKGRIIGVISINTQLDPGVLFKMIRDKIPLEGYLDAFGASPQNVGRLIMSERWR